MKHNNQSTNPNQSIKTQILATIQNNKKTIPAHSQKITSKQ